jgi:hypothetical protein
LKAGLLASLAEPITGFFAFIMLPPALWQVAQFALNRLSPVAAALADWLPGKVVLRQSKATTGMAKVFSKSVVKPGKVYRIVSVHLQNNQNQASQLSHTDKSVAIIPRDDCFVK